MEKIRKRIDEIDREIVCLLHKRGVLASEIAKIKKQRGIDIYLPERETEVLKNIRKHAEEYGLDEKYVAEIYKLILKNSRHIQGELHESKR